MRRRFLSVLVILMMAFLAACGGGNSNTNNTPPSSAGNNPSANTDGANNSGVEQIELRMAWWGGQERHDRTLKVIELYEKENPHIKIIPEYSGFDGYFDKLTTQFAAGNAPDIIQYGGNLNDFVARDVVLPLDDYVGEIIDLSKHSQSMIDAATIDGKFYGVTLGTNAFGLILNKTLFEEAGIPLPSKDWTWDDFREITKQLSDQLNGIYGTAVWTEDGFGIFLDQRNKVVHIDGEIAFDEEDVRDYFQLWKELQDIGAAANAELQASATQTPEQSLIVQRKVAMELIASNQFGAYQNATEDELMLFIAPINPETGRNGISLRPSQFLAGYAGTEHPEEVAKFLNFFVNNIDAGLTLGNDRGAPVNTDVLKALIEDANEIDQEVFSFIDWVAETSDAPYVPNLPGYNETTALFRRTMEAIAFERMTPEEGAADYYKQLLDITAKYTEE